MNGKHVVVSGAAGGLGRGVVEALHARGAIVHDTGDVRFDDEAAVTAFYKALPELWASVHLVGGFAMAKLTDTTLAQFEAQWRVNTVTCFLACREAVRAGAKRIVNVAARPAVVPVGGMIAYSAAKAGVAAITQALAAEDKGVLVNAVLPSTIDTPANRAAMPQADFGKWPTPREIGETIAFLVSPENTLTSGALVPVYGRA
ncbi:MAG TPA: SDR family oxidoreductase [Kofleriaceae bacterium]